MQNLIINPSSRIYLLNQAIDIFKITQPEFTNPQNSYIHSTQRNTLFNGGVGSGKTTALVWRLLYLAMFFPGKHMLSCFTYKMIQDIIFPKLFPILETFPKGCWNYRAGVQIIKFFDSEIYIRSLDDPEKIQGVEYRSINVDELTVKIKQGVFDQFPGRLREGNIQFFSAACNPHSKSHYAYEYFYLCTEKQKDYRRVVEAPTLSNIKNLPKSYIDDLLTRSPDWLNRYFYGKWGTMEGNVYKQWVRKTHLMDFKINPDWKFYLCVDFGFTAPFACLLVGRDSDDRYWVCKEYFKTERLIPFHAEYIRENMCDYPIEFIMPDSADSGNFYELEKELPNLYFKYPNKNVGQGIDKVREYVSIRPDGFPGVITHTDCINLCREWESYELEKTMDGKPINEMPKKINDHGLDPLRYLIYTEAI